MQLHILPWLEDYRKVIFSKYSKYLLQYKVFVLQQVFHQLQFHFTNDKYCLINQHIDKI